MWRGGELIYILVLDGGWKDEMEGGGYLWWGRD